MFQILRPWQTGNVVLTNSPGWLFPIMIFLSACQSTAIRDQAEPDVTLMAEHNYVTEDVGEIQVYLKRTIADELAEFKIQPEGDAKLGSDFLIESDEDYEGDSIVIQLLPGEHEKAIQLAIVDDIAAEADEKIILVLDAPLSYSLSKKEAHLEVGIRANDFVVTTTMDAGEGSLRQAMLNANAIEGADEIRFDSEVGPFGPPQSIVIEKPLPEITEQVTIDGYVKGFLWKRAGVTISGQNLSRIFKVAKHTEATIRNLTLTDGKARKGGAILNRGTLVVSGVNLSENTASRLGGAIVNLRGDLAVINSTLVRNRAGKAGGAIANKRGSIVVTNSTFSENSSKKGGALFNNGSLLLRNTILANSDAQQDCYSTDVSDSASTHNIIETNEGCPGVLFAKDPGLGSMKYYNGMTRTIALAGRSLAINSGDNASAVDEKDTPLQWDQRGNGDPRFVAGITDIGAFEVQAYPKLVVDTLDDGGPQGCSGMRGDCPLRAAIRLAELNGKPDTITFDLQVFSEPQELVLEHPLQVPTTEILIDASNVALIKVRLKGIGRVFDSETPDTLETRGLEIK
jgi:hypothetical protein